MKIGDKIRFRDEMLDIFLGVKTGFIISAYEKDGQQMYLVQIPDDGSSLSFHYIEIDSTQVISTADR